MKLAIVGSRDYPNPTAAVEELIRFYQPETIISGGALGIDGAAEAYALAYGVRLISLRVLNPTHGDFSAFIVRRVYVGGKLATEEPVDTEAPMKFAQMLWWRDGLIIEECDRAVAFWTGESPGTKHSIDWALKKRRRLEVIFP